MAYITKKHEIDKLHAVHGCINTMSPREFEWNANKVQVV